MISVAFAVLFIGLGIDFGIHLTLRYREMLAVSGNHLGALDGAARSVGTSITLCAGTTSLGFFAFVPTEFIGVAQLGWIAGIGMGVSLFFSLTLLPALLSLAPERVQARWASPASDLTDSPSAAWSGTHMNE